MDYPYSNLYRESPYLDISSDVNENGHLGSLSAATTVLAMLFQKS